MTNIISITVSYNGQYELLSECNTLTMTLHDIILFSVALLNIEYDNNHLELYKDSQLLYIETSNEQQNTTTTLPTKRALPSTTSLHDASINNGDLLVIRMVNPQQQQQQQQQALSSSTNNNQLDFSQLLGTTSTTTSAPSSTAAMGGGLDFSNLLSSTNNTATTNNNINNSRALSAVPAPQYYPSMSLDEVMHYNPHPMPFITLLLKHEHLYKELNYHNPTLARKLKRPDNTFIPIDNAVIIWREELVKGGIQSAFKATEKYHEETLMKQKLIDNPNDNVAAEYFNKKESQKLIDIQYHQMMEEYPESLGRILMLYINVKINNYHIQAFCDSGAQATIISKTIAKQCGIDHLIDTRFAGIAVGVGTGVILGRIHMVQLQINDTYFPCTVTVMDDPSTDNGSTNNNDSKGKSMPFLLGLDMMKRHLCQLDFQKGNISFYISHLQQYMSVPFLHEKDLTIEQGGTLGFNAQQSNDELMQQEEQDDNDVKDNNDDNKKKDDNDKDDSGNNNNMIIDKS